MAGLIRHLPLQEKTKQLWKIPAQGKNDDPERPGGLNPPSSIRRRK